MTQKNKIGSVTYRSVDKDYFERRRLKRYARAWSLWGLGVGAVISGHFSGWNLGIGAAGWGGLFIATIIIAIMYLGLVCSLAEMSPALPHTGGAYSFARSAIGPWAGLITGLAETVKYILTPAVIVFFISSYLTSIFETPDHLQPLWWLLCYIVFVALNCMSAELSFRIAIVVTILALGVLAVFWLSAIPFADFSRWALNIATGPDGELIELPNGGGAFLPLGWGSVLAAMPFAMWLFLALEQLPLAAEESLDPKQDMPKGLIFGMFTLTFSALMIVFFNASIGARESGQLHGAFSLATSSEPLLDGFRVIYGTDIAKLLALFAVIGLIASFHTIIFAAGRQIFALSRAGYYPSVFSLTHRTRRTPHIALTTGAGVGLTVILTVWLALGADQSRSVIAAILLNMAVFGATISYTLQGLSFILLRTNMPDIERPYRSPLGVPGAALTILIALVTLYCQLQDPVYRMGVYVSLAWYFAGVLYFVLVGRHRLVISPEERFALEHRKNEHHDVIERASRTQA
ncbi:MAG: amino acid permease [Gammaproteobacteria bacterium]|nr:amino acid ABC transporter permease [Gammaproteobacteria bacterium]